MKTNFMRPRNWLLGLFMAVLSMAAPKSSMAVHSLGACDSGDVNTNCTISSEHTVTGNVTILGDLTITSSGKLKFPNTGNVTLSVNGNLLVQGEIDAKGNNSTSGNAGNGGNLTIEVVGDVTISPTATNDAVVTVKGGNRTGSGDGNGGDGGNLTFNVCGNFTCEEANGKKCEISAKGGNGKGSGFADGNGGHIAINSDGNVAISGSVDAQRGGSLGNPNQGTITIDVLAGSALDTTGGVLAPSTGVTINQARTQPLCQAAGSDQGCSQGFWKNHTIAWVSTGYSTSEMVNSVFSSTTGALGSATLLEALSFKGGSTLDGAKQILLRQAVAALLNAAHPDVNYPSTLPSVIDAVNAQLSGGTRSTILLLAGDLDAYNNLGCPLN